MFGGNVLMEFPPIVIGDSLYFMRNNGGVYRLDADTGKVKWKNQIGRLSASSPAYWKGRVFVTSLIGQAHRPEGEQRQARVAEAARQPHGVLADHPARDRLLRHRGRRPVRALREDRPREVEVQRLRRDQGVARAVGLDALLRRLQRPDVRGVGAHRPRALVHRHVGIEVRLRGGQLLLDAGGRLRPRVRRQHRQQGVLVRRAQRHARVVQVDRRLRLLLPGRRQRAGHQADRVHRLLRRQPVRARRAHGLHALDRTAAAGASRAGRPWWGASSTSPTSTPRRPTAWTPARASGSSSAAAATTTRSSPTAAAST